LCQQVVKTYREDWAPCVPKMWDDLGEASFQTVHTGNPHEAYGVLYQLEDRWLTARLPSGRRLWYFNPQLTKRAMPWDETDVRMGWSYQQMKKGQLATIHAFGGLLTENVIQGLARDLMVNAMFKLEKNGFPIILTVHDEIVCEPMAEDADEKAFEQIMCDSPDWAKRMKMPIAVETWKGDRYRK
jgi:DNA polymerase bacteriophage-type